MFVVIFETTRKKLKFLPSIFTSQLSVNSRDLDSEKNGIRIECKIHEAFKDIDYTKDQKASPRNSP